MATKEILGLVREAAAKKFLYLPHAVSQMSRPDRMINTTTVSEVVCHGELVEDYPSDPRGHSCLIFKMVESRPIHVVCSPKEEFLAIITSYIPSSDEWEMDFKTRK